MTAPKHAAKPKVAPAAKKATGTAPTAAVPEGQKELDNVVAELFACYDQDGDGLIERVEFLDGEERRTGKIDFGPKQRREAYAWFVAAGASGTPTDGMFLSYEQFETAIVSKAKAGIEAEKVAGQAPDCTVKAIAAFLWHNSAREFVEALYGTKATAVGTSAKDILQLKIQFQKLDVRHNGYLELADLSDFLKKGDMTMTDDAVCKLFGHVDKGGRGKVIFDEFIDYVFAKAMPDAKAMPEAAGPNATGTPIVYPITIQFKDLAAAIHEARAVHRMVLVLASGVEAVETFMTYQNNVTIDCKEILGKVFIGKSQTKEDAQEDINQKLKAALNSSGFCRNLHLRLGNSAFDWVGFCHAGFPPEVFSGSLWTIQRALELGFIDKGHAQMLEVSDEKKWQDFHVIVTSIYDQAKASEHLYNKIPFYDELATIVIDPTSVA